MNNSFLKIINEGENQQIEFKESVSLSKNLAKDICAFANTKGGMVFIGIGDEKNIVGIKGYSEKLEMIANTLNHNLFPIVNAEMKKTEINNKTIILIFVKDGDDKPYKANHITYVRVGSTSRPATYDEERKLYIECGKIQVDTLPYPELKIEDFDSDLIEQYIVQREKQSGEKLNLTYEELLHNIECIIEKDGKLVPTIAGVLLFHKEPQKYIKQADVECVRFKGKDVAGMVIDRKNYSQGLKGPLYSIVDQIEQFIIKHMNLSSKIVGFGRIEYPEYPIEAIREMVVNAIVHRDYSIRGQNIRVFMFDDRIEIYTPGGLPKGISLEKIRKGESQTKLRNPVIVEVFKDLGGRYVEKLGTGIRKIIIAGKAHGVPAPFFDDTETDFLIRFFSPGEKVLEKEEHPNDIKKTELSHLNKRQIASLKLMVNEKKKLTNKQYREFFKVSKITAVRDLNQLVKEGLIVEEGKGRSLCYCSK